MLMARRDVLAAPVALPHPDRIVTLTVSAVEPMGADVLRVRLAPTKPGDCFCEFTPGQYLELWQPGAQYMSRAYSIANTPEGDGSVELHLRRVEGGRFTSWAFSTMKIGDPVQARGPPGHFTMRSLPETPLLFVAGGTGLAPVPSLLRQQTRFHAPRDMVLVWGAKQTSDLYALDDVRRLLGEAPYLRVTLAVEAGELPQQRERMSVVHGTVLDALTSERTLLTRRDVYAAGPPVMLSHLAFELDRARVAKDRVHIDSFGA
jgi:CDP-4-dehydro-6-deoxyglucose reductase, E3